MSTNNPIIGEIYWADLEPVKGSEQGGCRPVLVVSNNMMNKVSPVVLIAPLTRTEKVIRPFIIPYDLNDVNLINNNIEELKKQGYHFVDDIKNANILCQQTRAISKERLLMKIGNFKNNKYIIEVKQAISFLFAIEGCSHCHYPIRPGGLKCRNCGRRHSKKCIDCQFVFPSDYNFCPKCGRG